MARLRPDPRIPTLPVSEALGGTGQSSLSAGVVTITGGVSARALAARFGDRPTPFDFGAVGDGNTHLLSSRFATLAAAQAVYPHATALTQEIDWAALQAAVNYGPANGGPVGLPPAVLKIGASTVTLRKCTGLFGFNANSRDGISVEPNVSVIDATGNTNGIALSGPGNSVGITVQGLRLKNTSVSPSSGSVGINPGGFGMGPIIRDVNVTGFYWGVYLNFTQNALVENVWTDVQRFVGLDVNGAGGTTIVGSLFANVKGQIADAANLRIEGGAADVHVFNPLTDEGFNGAASILVLDADGVTLNLGRVFYTHTGYGIRLGNGVKNPTRCRIYGARVERFAAGAAPLVGIELRGSGHVLHDVVVDVSADGGASGLSDLATGTRLYNVTSITSGGTAYVAVQDPGLPSVAPAGGSKQLYYDPADGNRVKFVP